MCSLTPCLLARSLPQPSQPSAARGCFSVMSSPANPLALPRSGSYGVDGSPADSEDEAAGQRGDSGGKQLQKSPSSMQLPIIKQGWMDMRAAAAAQQPVSWLPSWFVLRGTTLAWHKDSDAARRGQAQGSLSLLNAALVQHPACDDEDSHPDRKQLQARTFGLVIVGEPVHVLRAAHQNMRSDWVTVLQKVKADAAAAAANPAGAAAILSPKSAAAATNAKEALEAGFQKDELCYGCAKEFTLVRRRHHCRRCLHAHCASCSGKRARVPNTGLDSKLRVCDECYTALVEGPSSRNRSTAVSVSVAAHPLAASPTSATATAAAAAVAAPSHASARSAAALAQASDEEEGHDGADEDDGVDALPRSAPSAPAALGDMSSAAAAADGSRAGRTDSVQPAQAVRSKVRATRPAPAKEHSALSSMPAAVAVPSTSTSFSTVTAAVTAAPASMGRSHVSSSSAVGSHYVSLDEESSTDPTAAPAGARRQQQSRGPPKLRSPLDTDGGFFKPPSEQSFAWHAEEPSRDGPRQHRLHKAKKTWWEKWCCCC